MSFFIRRVRLRLTWSWLPGSPGEQPHPPPPPSGTDPAQGHVFRTRVQVTCSGLVLRTRVQDSCSGHVFRTRVQDTCSEHVFRTRGQDTWSEHVFSRTRVQDTCSGHVFKTCVHQRLYYTYCRLCRKGSPNTCSLVPELYLVQGTVKAILGGARNMPKLFLIQKNCQKEHVITVLDARNLLEL